MDGEITPEAVEALVEDDADVRIVDIRPEGAYARGHIPGSENVPFAALTRDVERFAGAEHVVTVCPHGQSSVQAANLIASYEGVDADATVQSMAGGLVAWDGDLETADIGEREPDEGPEAPF